MKRHLLTLGVFAVLIVVSATSLAVLITSNESATASSATQSASNPIARQLTRIEKKVNSVLQKVQHVELLIGRPESGEFSTVFLTLHQIKSTLSVIERNTR